VASWSRRIHVCPSAGSGAVPWRPTLLLPLLALVACEPWGQALPDPDSPRLGQEALVVSPSSLDFGDLSVLEDGYASASFTIMNGGTETLTVHGYDEVAGDEDVFSVAGDPYMELAPGNSQTMLVTFRPLTEAQYWGELRINYGVETLDLAGTGQAPVLVVDRPTVPSVAVGCSGSFPLTVRNAGSEQLEVDGILLSDSTEYSVVDDSPSSLPTGETRTVEVVFSPVNGAWRSTSLAVTSNDPLWPDDQPATVVLEGLGVAGATATESFVYAPETAVDVLFVVDSSGIMGALLDRADEALVAWEEQLSTGNVDLHTAVLTGGSLCPTTSPTWLDGTEDSESRVALLQAGFNGSEGQWSDQLLDLAVSALRTETEVGGCLEGFLRAGAELQVVLVTGQADQGALDPDESLAALTAVAADNSAVRVSAVMATTSEGCDGTTYGDGYADVVVSSGGRVVDLCDSSWASGFQALADDCVLSGAGALTYELEAIPVVATLSVTVDGAQGDSWSYDAAANSVVFTAEHAPDVGADIVASYMLAQACD
jgi:hypothetical protein